MAYSTNEWHIPPEGRYGEEMSIESASTHSTVPLEKVSVLASSSSSWDDEIPSANSSVAKITPKKYPAPPPPQSPMNTDDFIRRPSVKKVRAPDIPRLPPRLDKKENIPVKSPVKGQKDPAEMSLKERLALFERNRGKPPLPKKPESMSSGGIREKIATLFSSSDNERKKDVDSVLIRHGINARENTIESIMRPLLPPPAPPSASPGKRKSGKRNDYSIDL